MRQSQKLFGLVILTMALSCCKFNNGFIIKGHIDGIKDSTWVKLYDIDQQVYIDSALSKNGNFVLTGVIENPKTCWLECENETAIIQIENTNFSFTSPIKNMGMNSSITGGHEQDLQNELTKLQKPYDIIYTGAYDSLVNNKFSNDSDKERLVKIFQESQSKSQKIYIDFGKVHSNSYLGLDIIYRNRSSINKDSLKLIYERLTPKFKEISTSKALQVYLYDKLAEVGKPFIDFQVKTINGEDFKLSSLKGQYIYLTFWAPGCGYCRMENKLLSKNINKLPEDLVLVSFMADKNAKNWSIYSKADSIVWYNVSDMEGDNGKVKTQYQVQAIPSSFLIDKNGIIIEQFLGFDQHIVERLNDLIEKNNATNK